MSLSLLRKWSVTERMPNPSREIDDVSCKTECKRVEPQRLQLPTLINQRSYLVLPSAIIIYVILQIIFSYDTCDEAMEKFSSWTQFYYFGSGFAFSVSVLQHSSKAYHCYGTGSSQKKSLLHMAAATISAISGSSAILTYAYDYDGICEDALGIETRAAVWSQRIICLPLLVYIVISGEGKEVLSTLDSSLIFSFFLTVLLIGLMNSVTQYRDGVILFVFSCLLLISTMFQAFLKIEISSDKSLFISATRNTLLMLTCGILPIVPILYLCRLYHLIDRDQLDVSNVLVNVFVYLIFLNSLVDEQINVAEKIKSREEAELLANETRRTFLRYVFHELRIPLNTVTMGMTLMENIDSSIECKKALVMMNGATSFINDTLTDVLFMHEIEEGAFKVSKNPFRLNDMIKDPIRAVKMNAQVKNVNGQIKNVSVVLRSMSNHENSLIIGDKIRIETVILNFLENAIQLSPEGSNITVKVFIKYINTPVRTNLLNKISDAVSANSAASIQSVKKTFSSNKVSVMDKVPSEFQTVSTRTGIQSPRSPISGSIRTQALETPRETPRRGSGTPRSDSAEFTGKFQNHRLSPRDALEASTLRYSRNGSRSGSITPGTNTKLAAKDPRLYFNTLNSPRNSRGDSLNNESKLSLKGPNSRSNSITPIDEHPKHSGKDDRNVSSIILNSRSDVATPPTPSNNRRPSSVPTIELGTPPILSPVTFGRKGSLKMGTPPINSPVTFGRKGSQFGGSVNPGPRHPQVPTIELSTPPINSPSYPIRKVSLSGPPASPSRSPSIDPQRKKFFLDPQLSMLEGAESQFEDGKEDCSLEDGKEESIQGGINSKEDCISQAEGVLNHGSSVEHMSSERVHDIYEGQLCPPSPAGGASSPAGGGERFSSRICEVTLLVTDEGSGISKEDLNGLTTPYSQIRPEQLEQGRGTGLWLVLAKEIVELHNGSLIVTSTVGKGSTFGFTIPFSMATPVEKTSEELRQAVNHSSMRLVREASIEKKLLSLSSSSNSPGGNSSQPKVLSERKFLVVDDTPSNSKMLSMVLKNRLIDCDIAENGQQAVSLVVTQKKIYDFIFMDFTMPIMNGADAVRAIRKMGHDRLIFGLTGNALNDDIGSFISAGCDCVLSKPLRACHLDAILVHTSVHGFKSHKKSKFSMEKNQSNQTCHLSFM